MKFIENKLGCIVIIVEFKKIIVVKAFINKMFMYSAIKNKANGPAAYSTLKPETSSDSPSVRSKGARFVSARVDTNHIIASGHVGRINQMFFCVIIRVDKVKEPFSNRTERRMMASVTS